MKTIVITFDRFSLHIDMQQEFVLYVSWLGETERFSINQFCNLIEQVKQARA